MGSIKQEVETFIVNASAYAYEKSTDGETNGEYGFIREIDVTIYSPYGQEASLTLTVDEAKEAIKLLQEAIRKASQSDKELIKSEKKREKDLSHFFDTLRAKRSEEKD